MIGHYTATSGTEIRIPRAWSAMVVQTKGVSALTVEAKTQYASDYENIGAIKLSDYSIADIIDSNGLYMIDLTGLDFVKFTFSGGSVYYNVE